MVQSEAEVSVLNRNRGEQRQWMGVVCVQHQVSTRSSKQGEARVRRRLGHVSGHI